MRERERERERCFVITSPDKWTRDSLIPPPLSPQLRIIGDPSNQLLASRIFRSNEFSDYECNQLRASFENCWSVLFRECVSRFIRVVFREFFASLSSRGELEFLKEIFIHCIGIFYLL